MSHFFQNIVRMGNLAFAILALSTFVGLASPSAVASANAIVFTAPTNVPSVNPSFGSTTIPSKYWPTSAVFQGVEYVFTVGTDNHVYCNTRNGSQWGINFNLLGNFTTNAPVAATSYFGSYLYIFVTDTTGHIYYETFDGTRFSALTSVPGNGKTSNFLPVGVVEYNNLLFVFLTGTDGHVYYQFYNGFYGTWSGVNGYASVPNNGKTFQNVTPVVAGNNLDVFLVGTDYHPYLTVLNYSTWSNYSPVLPNNGLTYASVSATFFDNQVFLFLVGTDRHLYYNSTYNQSANSNTIWTGYTQVPGVNLNYSNTGIGVDSYTNPNTQATNLDVFFADPNGLLSTTSGS